MAKIILTDDSTVFRSALKKILEDEGHTILGEASNAEETFKLLENNIADVLLLDLLMPGKTGLDVLKEIKNKYVNLKVLIITAVNQKAVNEEAKKLGASAVLYKPFDAPEIIAMIKKIMTR